VAQQKLILPPSSDGEKVDAVLGGIYPELPREAQRRTARAGSPG